MEAPAWGVILVAIFGVVAAIVVTALFFDAYGALKRRWRRRRQALFVVEDFFGYGESINVHLKDHTLIPRARLVGFRRKGADVPDAPPHLMNMAAFESEDGRRIYLDPNAIRMLEAVPPMGTPAQRLADDLERHLAGRLKLEVIARRMQSGVYGDTAHYATLSHYLADADMRARDADYKAMQEAGLRRYIGLLREDADAARLASVSFLKEEST